MATEEKSIYSSFGKGFTPGDQVEICQIYRNDKKTRIRGELKAGGWITLFIIDLPQTIATPAPVTLFQRIMCCGKIFYN